MSLLSFILSSLPSIRVVTQNEGESRVDHGYTLLHGRLPVLRPMDAEIKLSEPELAFTRKDGKVLVLQSNLVPRDEMRVPNGSITLGTKTYWFGNAAEREMGENPTDFTKLARLSPLNPEGTFSICSQTKEQPDGSKVVYFEYGGKLRMIR